MLDVKVGKFDDVKDCRFVNWDSDNGYYGSDEQCLYCEFETPAQTLSLDGVPVCNECAEREERQKEYKNALDYWRLEGEDDAIAGRFEDPPEDNMAFCRAYRKGFRGVKKTRQRTNL